MLRSTHIAAAPTALLPGWTEHKAPSGYTYYYNAETEVSTYTRPSVPTYTEAPTTFASYPNLADPKVANAYVAQLQQASQAQQHGQQGYGRGRGGFQGKPRPEPIDRPRRKEVIPGCEPWLLVYTKYSRRFVYNPTKNISYWRIPEKLMPGILELDKQRIRDKAKGETEDHSQDAPPPVEPALVPAKSPPATATAGDEGDSSEYEEVEVTDDESGADDIDSEHPSKRPRLNQEGNEEEDAAVEFTEDDIAAQLQAMGEAYGLEPGDYDDGNMDEWPEGAEGVEFSEEDAKLLFQDLLNDFGINPYSPWDKLLEEGKVMDDPRYSALATTKARKECWDEWSRAKIAELREARRKQEKKDPRVAYMGFLQEKASPKLYWPEFKRKYKREVVMKDLSMQEKDKEKAYREHIARLKLPQTTLKGDLAALLRSQPLHLLHNKSLSAGLPSQILADARYISLPSQIRDPIIEAYVQTLPPPPEDVSAAAEEDEERKKEKEKRERRELALEERDKVVEEQQRRREKDVRIGKARLREEEREIEDAMKVGKRGLRGQLKGDAGEEPENGDGE